MNRYNRVELNLPLLSLMQPTPLDENLPRKTARWEEDIGLNDLLRAFTPDQRYMTFIQQTLTALTTDPEVIQWRQKVLGDFLRNPALIGTVQEILPMFINFRHSSAQLGQRRRNLLVETSDRLAELDLYLEIVQKLHTALNMVEVESEAFTSLRNNLYMLINNPDFQRLREELPVMRAPLQNIRSLTVGINLDTQLRPESAVLLAIHERKFGEPQSFLERLLGTRTDPDDETGLAALNHLPQDPEMRILDPLFQDLDRVLTSVMQPIARALNRYVRVSTRSLIALENELAFFVAGAQLIQRLTERGIQFCQPQIAAKEMRLIQIDGLVNINLALDSIPVASDAHFDDNGRIAILTGPNSGGKTTYLRSVGLAQVLFQAGLFIPALSAQLTPVDRILTHFPALETQQQGRLAEEAERLREVFASATEFSLVLLNETFSSTSSGEAQYLAQDILSALCAIGVRAIFATHLIELVERIPDIEAAIQTSKSRVYSLVAGVALDNNSAALATYEIRPGKPLGRSYAQEIARRYGISLDQILANREPSTASQRPKHK